MAAVSVSAGVLRVTCERCRSCSVSASNAKWYTPGARPAVEGLTFTLPMGETWALLGGNGAGKSTTIAMLLGLLVPSAGRVVALGHDMATDRFAALARMNFSSPYIALPHRLTVRENLTVYAWLYAVPAARQRVRELAADLAIGELLDRPTGKLSAGQKTRVALAKALLNRPELLLLDEPTASLDPDTADWVRTRLEDYRRAQGATIVLASHNMAEVERLADRVIMLEKGRIIADATPGELVSRFGRANLEETFLAIARRGAGDAELQP